MSIKISLILGILSSAVIDKGTANKIHRNLRIELLDNKKTLKILLYLLGYPDYYHYRGSIHLRRSPKIYWKPILKF